MSRHVVSGRPGGVCVWGGGRVGRGGGEVGESRTVPPVVVPWAGGGRAGGEYSIVGRPSPTLRAAFYAARRRWVPAVRGRRADGGQGGGESAEAVVAM